MSVDLIIEYLSTIIHISAQCNNQIHPYPSLLFIMLVSAQTFSSLLGLCNIFLDHTKMASEWHVYLPRIPDGEMSVSSTPGICASSF
jgi:hypothetical protein